MFCFRRKTDVFALVLFLMVGLSGFGVLRAAAAPSKPVDVTLAGLIEQMVDMQRLAVWAGSNEAVSRQFSSYDRASTSPDKEGWFANGDAGKFIRKEQHGKRTEHVMADMSGPGAIVRIWSANPEGGGTIRIYLDDMEQPALEANLKALTEAGLPEFPAPFSGLRSRGANLYFPFPYQQRCKVTVSKAGLYYHIGYKTFAAGTRVERFSMAALPGLRKAMARVGDILAHPESGYRSADAVQRRYDVTLQPKKTLRLATISGPAAVSRMTLKVAPDARGLREVLRGALLEITFDDASKPSVQVPLGDFFGSAPGLNPFQSLPNGMSADGTCYSNWAMPFFHRAEMRITNHAEASLSMQWGIQVVPWAVDEARTLVFHASWRKQWFPKDPKFLDWPILEADGPGRFTGVMLAVVNTTPTWWGEGDEKVWVDDDSFPSFFGTGSEDYFGYAWCNPALFTHAYHNQSICTGPGNFGYTAVARYHVFDDIPFRRHIRFCIEKWDASPREYAATAYWYAAAGAGGVFPSIKAEDLTVRPLTSPSKIKGALEGEDMIRRARCSKGKIQVQYLNSAFSGWRHLWWVGGGPGARLDLRLPLKHAGRYKVIVGCTRSWDYGMFRFSVNGKATGEPVDLYAPKILPLTVDLGEFDLTGTTVDLGLTCVGTNPKVKARNFMAGIDYILLEPVQK